MDTTVTTVSSPVSLPFTDIELTDAINNLPTPFGQLTGEGFFPGEGIASQTFEVDIIDGVLSALPVTGDGPPTVAKHDSMNARIFKVPSIQHFDNIKAADVRGWLQMANRARNGPETLATLMNRRLQRFKQKFNLTWELMRMGALKGQIVDGKGAMVLDLFKAFEITEKVVYFDLTNANADIQGACDQIYALITDDLSDETMDTVEARVSRDFFNALITHPKVEKFWLQAEQALQLANAVRGEDGGYKPRRLTLHNVTFIEYSAVVPMWGGTNAPIIAAGTGHAYPKGTMDTHYTYIAPPEDIRKLDGSAAGVEDAIYVTTEPLKHGKGVEMLGQMNALPFWRRPKLLVKLLATAGASTAAKDGN